MTQDTPTASPATFIAVGAIADDAAFRDYAAKATPLLNAAGGTLLARQTVTGSIHGAAEPGIVLTMRFEDEATIHAVFASDAYAALIPIRDRAFRRLDLWTGPAT